MNLEKYEDYFKNILARTFVTNAQKKTITLQNSEVTDVFIEVYANKKSHILGKTKEHYFIINYTKEPYEFSVVLIHNDPIVLLENFEDKTIFTHNIPTKDYIEKLFFKYELEKDLEKKIIQKKSFKI